MRKTSGEKKQFIKRWLCLLLTGILCLGCAAPGLGAGRPSFVSQPQSVTAETGGEAVFRISARNYGGITWVLTDPVSGESETARTLTNRFPEMKVEGTNGKKLTLKNVPAEMNGWLVRCRLSGGGHRTMSDIAFLYVGGEGAQDAAPTPGPWLYAEENGTAEETKERTVIDQVHAKNGEEDFAFPADARLLEIWFPNIRDADAAILTYEGTAWMIDCGDERWGARGAALLKLLGISRVEKLLNSHPHHDHLNGLKVTDNAAKVQELLLCFPENATDHSVKAVKACRDRDIAVCAYGEGSTFAMGDGDVSFTVWQNTDAALDMNNRSAVILIRCGERSILFTGDMEQPGQRDLMSRTDPAALKCDILKYPHHGKSALDEEFYAACSPEITVVTSIEGRGDNGQKWIRKKGLTALYTNKKDKYLHLTTDGKTWLCEYVSTQELKRGRE